MAHGIVTFDGKELTIEVPAAPLEAPLTLGGNALGSFTPGSGERVVLASNADAKKAWEAGIEEWKLLTSAALTGIAREAVELAATYATEREAFGQPIGAYQGIGHPLAVDIIDVDGAALLQMWTLRALADGAADAGGFVSTLFWWASRTATNCVAHAIHTFGGYGLSEEYDIQLYHRRAKAWALALGDPEAELERGGRRLFLGEAANLPDPGAVEIDFESPDKDNALAEETRAVRDGDGWVINGQKMFTSGAELASYVLLLTRTDPDVAKHKGLTLFLVPLKMAGIEIQPVHTFMDERTNATFYADVRSPDYYRLGEVNGGVKAMAMALSMEQGGSYYYHQMRSMVAAVTEWARTQERGEGTLLEHPDTLARLARVYTHAAISESLSARALWTRLIGEPDLAYGPSSKIFTTEAFITNSADLLNLAAPDSLVRGKSGLGVVEIGYRHSTATSIYGGASEVLRSMVAEKRLGLPRSRA